MTKDALTILAQICDIAAQTGDPDDQRLSARAVCVVTRTDEGDPARYARLYAILSVLTYGWKNVTQPISDLAREDIS